MPTVEIFDFTESEQVFLSKAEQLCAAGEQCRSGVRDKLSKWGATREQTDHIVNYLTENNYIDEERYCRIYCDSKLHLQKWGRVKIAYRLREKHIDGALIDKALREIDPDLYHSTLSDLLSSKMRTLNEPDERKRRTKLMSFLSSHGFTVDEIEKALSSPK